MTIENVRLATLPDLIEHRSPFVVLALDKIRSELEDKSIDYGEFCWFAREYPRCYRFHVDGATHRLKSICGLMLKSKDELIERSIRQRTGEPADADDKRVGEIFEYGMENEDVHKIYWDFESYLSEISISLDLLARIIGPAFKEHTPLSFNKICKVPNGSNLITIFRKAQKYWVNRLKDYRDCFTHYTPVDTLLMVVLRKYDDEWVIRAKLPVNPNARDIMLFKYNRRTELLGYAISVYKHMMAFDKAIANEIRRLYKNNNFPVRKDNLFFVGARTR